MNPYSEYQIIICCLPLFYGLCGFISIPPSSSFPFAAQIDYCQAQTLPHSIFATQFHKEETFLDKLRSY